MKRFTMAAAALALMSGAAFAQQAPGQPGQPADPEQAQQKGTINQPMGGVQTDGAAKKQLPPDDQSRKPGANPPSSNTGNSGQK